MTDKEIRNLIETSLAEKIKENSEFIRYTFFETDVKFNLKPIDKYTFLRFLRIKLENNNYKVYTQKNEYKYKNEVKIIINIIK